jgi:hypothetical protein
MNEEQLAIIEESAFYESGLSAHGCLEKLDSYTLEAIERYGRYLLQNQKEINDYKNGFFLIDENPTKIKCHTIPFVERIVHKAASLEIENEHLERQLKDLKEDLRRADCEYIEAIKQITKLENEVKSLKNL